METFILYWKNIEVGELTKTGWDMRSAGYIKFKFDYHNQRKNELSKYISHSIKGSDYLKKGDEENYKALCVQDEKYLDIINSPEWEIEDKNGNRIGILCPAFHSNNEITWQKTYEN